MKKKWTKKMGVIIFVVGVLYAILVFSLVRSAGGDRYEKEAQNVIILGAQVRGTPAVPSNVLKERLDAALAFLETSPDAIIIVCGGQGPDESATEASVMCNYLVEHGIDPMRIRLEQTSTSTKENVRHAIPLLQPGKTVIISNDYHVYRAKMIAKRLGIEDVEGFAAQSRTNTKTKNYVREIFVLGYDMLFCWK